MGLSRALISASVIRSLPQYMSEFHRDADGATAFKKASMVGASNLSRELRLISSLRPLERRRNMGIAESGLAESIELQIRGNETMEVYQLSETLACFQFHDIL